MSSTSVRTSRRKPLQNSQTSPSGKTRAKPIVEQTPLSLREMLGAAILPLPEGWKNYLWGMPSAWEPKAARKTIESRTVGALTAARQKQQREQFIEWLDSDVKSARHAWEGLIWLRLLPRLAPQLDDALLQRSWQRFNELSRYGNVSASDDPLRFQLLCVELPATLATTVGTSQRQPLVEIAERSLLHLAQEWLDGEGVPQGRHLEVMLAVLASWTRTLLLPATQGQQEFREIREQYSWLLRQVLQFTRADGGSPFEASTSQSQEVPTATAAFFQQALEFAADTQSNALYAVLHDRAAKPSSLRRSAQNIEPAVYSEWGKVATLRTAANRTAPHISITFDQAVPRLELFSEQLLLQGTWTAELEIDGTTYQPSEPWDEVCWYIDDDAVYLELETRFPNGWRLQRQVLLARQENFLLLADSILGDYQAKLNYRSSLQLAAGASVECERETNEAWLQSRGGRWLVLPLALPEWRSAAPQGSLQRIEQKLQHAHSRTGTNLYAPLLIPLNPARSKVDYTWRRLTVAEQLDIQSPDVAVAYRAQVGDRQWAIYRSLTEQGNRTFLGKNLATEFFVGLFHRSGSMDTIMEVE